MPVRFAAAGRGVPGGPPAWRNHRAPTGHGTPTATDASTVVTPVAMTRRRWRCTARDDCGRPGERIGGRNARSARHCRRAPSGTSLVFILQCSLARPKRTPSSPGRPTLPGISTRRRLASRGRAGSPEHRGTPHRLTRARSATASTDTRLSPRSPPAPPIPPHDSRCSSWPARRSAEPGTPSGTADEPPRGRGPSHAEDGCTCRSGPPPRILDRRWG